MYQRACAFRLRRGRVISSGVLDVFDVADADPEMNGCGVAIGAEAAVRSELVTGHERGSARDGRGVTLGLE